MDNIKLLNVPYGASELKAVAPKYTFRGFISALTIYAFVAGGIILNGHLNSTADVPQEKQPEVRVIVLDDIPPLSVTQPEQPEQVSRDENVPTRNDEAMTPVPVSKTEAEIQTTKTHEDLNTVPDNVSRDGQEGVTGNNDGLVVSTPEVPETPVEEEVKPPAPVKTIYEPYEVQKTPNALNLGQIQGRMQYPKMAIQQGIEGRVTVRILVGKDGSILRVGNMTGNSIFHDEVGEKIEGLQFTPAIVNGQPVSCWVVVPFSFKLKNNFGD